jgi:CheY-like chemotaxis protein
MARNTGRPAAGAEDDLAFVRLVQRYGERQMENTSTDGETGEASSPAPDEQRSAVQADARPTAGKADLSLMIVEDDPAFVYLVERYVSKRGWRVLSAETGKDALDMARQEQPAAIFLDLTLPGANGWDILHALRADDATAAIPVVICSALDEEARSREEGADGFLRKPVLRRRFLSVLAEVGIDLTA